jgi:hypothetical protein
LSGEGLNAGIHAICENFWVGKSFPSAGVILIWNGF